MVGDHQLDRSAFGRARGPARRARLAVLHGVLDEVAERRHELPAVAAHVHATRQFERGYIKDGTLADGKKVGDYSYKSASSAATLDQKGCHYTPHVMGVMVNQPISITNSDPTTHNVHFRPTKNPDWNQSQPNGAGPLSHKLAVSEVLVPVKCDQHPWMRAFIGVMKHPFFAVSGEDGSFTISGVPPGKYTVVAWHEGPGSGTEKTMEVTVAAKAPATADFTFGATAELRGKPSSIPVVSAIEFPMLRK